MATIAEAGYRRGRLLIVALLVSSFGPYVVPGLGLRLEHLVIYGLAALLIMELMLRGDYRRDASPLLIAAALLVTAAAWTLASSLGTPKADVTLAMRVAGLENFLQPAALLMVVGLSVQGVGRESRVALLRVAIRTYLVLLAVNSAVALATIYTDVWPLARHFVASSIGPDAASTWQRAAAIGRFTGLFNQPIEAGLAYSAGVIGWAYLVGSYRTVSWRDWFLFGAVALGGVLSVSKTFLFVGFPAGLLYWALWAGRHQVARPRTVLAIGTAGIAGAALLQKWQAAAYAMRFFGRSATAADIRDLTATLDLLTAGRYAQGVESTVQRLFAEVMAGAPVHGFGFGAYPTLENAYLEYLYLGGLVALGFYLAVLGIMGGMAALGRVATPRESTFLAVLLALMLAAGLGGPVLTINRASVALTVFSGLAMMIIAGDRLGLAERAATPPQEVLVRT
jgi:hypothetical protein